MGHMGVYEGILWELYRIPQASAKCFKKSKICSQQLLIPLCAAVARAAKAATATSKEEATAGLCAHCSYSMPLQDRKPGGGMTWRLVS